MSSLSHRGRAQSRSLQSRSARAAFRPVVEQLEDRRLLSAGALDPTFGSGGKVTTAVPVSATDAALAVAFQPDGKVLAAGSSGDPGDQTHTSVAVARYNTNGSLDASFGKSGRVLTAFGGEFTFADGQAIAVEPDGKIVVAGNQPSGIALIRYNPNGSLDTSFAGSGKVATAFVDTVTATSVALQADGKIVVAGETGTSSSAGNYLVARYNPDGSLDTTFDGSGIAITSGGPFGEARAVTEDATGKILVVGDTSHRPSGPKDFAAVRFNPNGTLDATFGSGGKVTTSFAPTGFESAAGVTVQADGKIRLAGISGTNFALAQYNGDGSLDTTFGSGGKVTTPLTIPFNLAEAVFTADGKIATAGTTLGGDFAVARFNADGSHDTSFGGTGETTTDFGGAEAANAIAAQADGSLAVAGQTDSNGGDFAVARYNPDGSLTASFGGTGKVTTDFSVSTVSNDNATSGLVALQLDGKTLVAGTVRPDGPFGDGNFAVTRYNTNGSLDTSFGNGGLVVLDLGGDDVVGGIGVDLFGRITLAGATGAQFNHNLAVVRLNPNGTLDSTFGTGGETTISLGSDAVDNGVAVDFFGRVVVAGTVVADPNSGLRDLVVARLTAAGAPDTSFNGTGVTTLDLGSDDVAAGVALDFSGRAVVAATTGDPFGGAREVAVARFLSNGTLDSGFGTGGVTKLTFGGDDVAAGVALDLSGRILVAGTASDPFALTSNMVVARLTSAGALDSSFGLSGETTINLGGNTVAAGVAVDLLGRVIVAGSLTGPDGNRDITVTRLRLDGTADSTFGTGGTTVIDFGGDDVAGGVAVNIFGRVTVAGTSFGDDGPDFAVARLRGSGIFG